MYGYIYLTTNLLNNKKYIGKHRCSEFDFEKYKGSGNALKRAFNKYGKNNFKCELMLEQFNIPVICNSKEELDKSEIAYINLYNAVEDDNFYNIAEGGTGGNLGEKVNQKISAALKGRVLSTEWRNKLKKPKSKETRLKLSIACKGRPSNMKGKHHTEETKKILSEKLKGQPTWNKGIPRPDYVKNAVRKANTGNKYRVGKQHTIDTKNKLRERALLRPKRKWYHNDLVEKFILIDEIGHYETLGYKRGRLKNE